jgi:D-alanyl-D-alanine carboxypeptidase/D-alanyl-D-alanine-endopeptidase (penicillin-binding protein 4)
LSLYGQKSDQKPAFYSYIIGDVKNDLIDTESYSDLYLTPASCQKTITSLLAYKVLGSDYRYRTQLYIAKHNKQIQNVVVTFSGDPILSLDNLVKLLEPIKGKKIKGEIFLDVSLFGTPAHSPNIMINDIGTSYAQPVYGANIDQNLIKIKIIPDKLLRSAIVLNDSGYSIDSKVSTSQDISSIKSVWDDGKIKVFGNVNENDFSQELKISPTNIDRYILNKILIVMKALKIKGKLRILKDKSTLTSGLNLINVVESKSLGEIIPWALAESNNLVFDSLYLKMINHQNSSVIRDWNEGDKIMKTLIDQYFNIKMEKALFVDGSGLSRYNRVQPKKLFSLLKKGYFNSEFVASLPRPGQLNSTLSNRTNLPSGVVAKTGSMSGISCLCGYHIDSKGSKAFVIIANNFAPPSGEIQLLIDSSLAKYFKN